MSLWVANPGCGCCEDPPPPPPPPVTSAYYGYYGLMVSQGCGCLACLGAAGGYGGRVPCRWQIEVSGFANGPTSGTCTTSTNCANNNGTFILTGGGGGSSIDEVYCQWSSPTFSTSIIQPAFDPMTMLGTAFCLNSADAYYRLRVYYYPLGGDYPVVELALVDATNSIIQVLWDWAGAANDGRLDCMAGTRTLTKRYEYVQMGTPCCCHGAPATIDVVPL